MYDDLSALDEAYDADEIALREQEDDELAEFEAALERDEREAREREDSQ